MPESEDSGKDAGKTFSQIALADIVWIRYFAAGKDFNRSLRRKKYPLYIYLFQGCKSNIFFEKSCIKILSKICAKSIMMYLAGDLSEKEGLIFK